MEATPKELLNYIARNGKRPFPEWRDALRDLKARAKIRIRLDRVQQGNLGDCRSLGDGVFELKIDYGPGYRIYFGQIGPTIILLLCGGDKRTQAQDIQTAKDYWTDYRSRTNDPDETVSEPDRALD